jgi:hypothetical protein
MSIYRTKRMSGHNLGLVWHQRNQARARAAAEKTLDPNDLRNQINKIKSMKGNAKMHYKNGREAKNGDKVVLIPDPKYQAASSRRDSLRCDSRK